MPRILTEEEKDRAFTSWREDLVEAFGELYAAFPNIRESEQLEHIRVLLEDGPILIDPIKYAQSLLEDARIDQAEYQRIVADYKKGD